MLMLRLSSRPNSVCGGVGGVVRVVDREGRIWNGRAMAVSRDPSCVGVQHDFIDHDRFGAQ